MNLIQSMSQIIRSMKGRISDHHIYAFKLFLITRIILQIIGVITRIFPTQYFRPISIVDIYWLDFWAKWDGAHLMEIALNGYDWHPSMVGYAFFPLYPLTIKIFAFQSKLQSIFVGIAISNIALYCSSILIYNIVLKDQDRKHAYRAMKYLYIFPYSMLLSGVYSESLLLFLILLSVYFAKEGKWFHSSIVGYLAGLTKITGVFIVIYLGYEYMHQKEYDLAKIKSSILYLTIPILAPLSFMYYNFVTTGNFFTFLIVQQRWNRIYRNPFQSLLEGLLFFESKYRVLTSWVLFIVIILLSFQIKKLGYGYFVWSMFMIFTPMMTAWYSVGWMSLTRQILPVFPIYIALALSTRNKKVDILVTTICSISLIVIMYYWGSGISIVI